MALQSLIYALRFFSKRDSNCRRNDTSVLIPSAVHVARIFFLLLLSCLGDDVDDVATSSAGTVVGVERVDIVCVDDDTGVDGVEMWGAV